MGTVASWAALLTAIAGVGGVLVYIARLVHRGVRLMDQLGDMPRAHAALSQQTQENTAAIAELTDQVRWLRAAMMTGRRRG